MFTMRSVGELSSVGKCTELHMLHLGNIASVHWLKSEHPPNIWKSQSNVLWIWLSLDKMSRSYMNDLISQQSLQGKLWDTVELSWGHPWVFKLSKVTCRSRTCLSEHDGGSGASGKFKLGIHEVWVWKLCLITQKLADVEYRGWETAVVSEMRME